MALHGKWSSGDLILYDGTQDILTIKDSTDGLVVGEDDLGLDVKFYGATSGSYMLWDQSENKLVLVGSDFDLGGDLTITVEDIHLTDNRVINFGTDLDVSMGWVSATSILQISPLTDNVGTINIGNGTKDIDLKVFLSESTKYVLFDADAALLTLSAGVSLDVDDTTVSSSSTTGSIHTAGGLGVVGAIFGGSTGNFVGQLNADATTVSSGVTTGALVCDGGLGVAGVAYFGGTIYPQAATTSISMPGGAAYIPMQVGTKSSTAGDGFKIAGSGDNSGGIQLYADDAGVAAVGEVITPFRSRYLLTVNQSGGVTQTALFAQLVSGGTGTRTYTTGGFRAAYVFNQQGTTTLVTSAECVGINQATTLAGTMTVGAGCSFSGIDINIAGAGAISNSGTCAALLVRSSGTPVWTNGIQIKDAGSVTGVRIGTCTSGVIVTGATNLGVSVVSTALAVGDDYSGIRSAVSCAAPSNAYGAAGYFQADYAGTGAGHFYGFGSWINFGAAAVTGGYHVCAQDNGIYGTVTATDTRLIFGLKMEAIITGTPGAFCPFYIGTDNKAITAIFDIASGPALNLVNGTPTAAADGSIPFCVDAGGTVRYIHVYGSRN